MPRPILRSTKPKANRPLLTLSMLRVRSMLPRACASHSIPIIHISTDYVFDGAKDGPYLEGDPTGPINVYGLTKLEGEQRVMNACERHLILRTAWVYSPWGANFVKTMLRLATTRRNIGVVEDQLGSPTYAPDLAENRIERGRSRAGRPVCMTLGHLSRGWRRRDELVRLCARGFSARARERLAHRRGRRDRHLGLSNAGAPPRQFPFELRQVAAVVRSRIAGLAAWGCGLRLPARRIRAGQVISDRFAHAAQLPTLPAYAMRSVKNIRSECGHERDHSGGRQRHAPLSDDPRGVESSCCRSTTSQWFTIRSAR